MTTLHRRTLATLALAITAALGAATATDEQAPPVWTISDTPVVTIGSTDDDSLELAGPSSAVRLANGDIVITHGRMFRLHWYNAAGRLVRIIGRRGQGPGEFTSASIQLYALPGDTIVASTGGRRYNRFAPNGAFVRMDSAGDPRRTQWLYDRSVVRRTEGHHDFAALRATLARIPLTPRDTVRVVRFDAGGNAWVRDPVNRRAYTIHDRVGRRIGTATFPEGFTLFHIGDSLVIGHAKDQDDFEFIQVRTLRRTGTAPTTAPPPARAVYDQDAELRTHASVIGAVRVSMRNLATMQEAYYSDYLRYATSLEELRRHGLTPRQPPGGTLAIFAAEKNGYGLLGQHPDTRVICVVLLDGEMIPGAWDMCG
jgi:hypothetical protein